MPKLSDLTNIQKHHLAWRLDAKTGCGYITAGRIARGELGDLDLVVIFTTFGGLTRRNARYHALKVLSFELKEPNFDKILAVFKSTARSMSKWSEKNNIKPDGKVYKNSSYKIHKEAIAEYERQLEEYSRQK